MYKVKILALKSYREDFFNKIVQIIDFHLQIAKHQRYPYGHFHYDFIK